MLKLSVTYPSRDEERVILDRMGGTAPLKLIDSVMAPEDILTARRLVDQIYIDERIKDYIVDLVQATRRPQEYKLPLEGLIQYGASPRATIYLTLGAKASAFLGGNGFVTPQDVKNVAMDVLRHRVIVTYEAEAEEKTSEDVVQQILDHVPVP